MDTVLLTLAVSLAVLLAATVAVTLEPARQAVPVRVRGSRR